MRAMNLFIVSLLIAVFTLVGRAIAEQEPERPLLPRPHHSPPSDARLTFRRDTGCSAAGRRDL